MKYIAFIPARSGSKGIPGKNKIQLLNKPLVSYTFEAASQSKLINETHLSTDDDEIADLARQYAVKSFYKRPVEIAGDQATIFDALQYHIAYLKQQHLAIPENIILLQPTSPVRSKELIDNCIRAFENSGKESLAAVSKSLQHPYEMFTKENGKNIFISADGNQRQQYPEYYFITGSVYIAKLDFILSRKKFFDEDSAIYMVTQAEAVDVDESSDLDLAAYYLNKMINL
jgi:CMP-N,N'-diacetyllegionaminic acid synthase